MTQILKAWQCIGCGKLEEPQTCIGICQDRRVELVYASEYDDLAKELARARAASDVLASALAAMVEADPRDAASVQRAREAAQRALAARAATAATAAATPAVASVDDAGGARAAAARDTEPKTRDRRPATLIVR